MPPASGSSTDRREAPQDAGARSPSAERSAIRFGQRWLLLLLAAMLCVFVYMTRLFFVPVIVAAVFTTLLYPLQERLVLLLVGRR